MPYSRVSEPSQYVADATFNTHLGCFMPTISSFRDSDAASNRRQLGLPSTRQHSTFSPPDSIHQQSNVSSTIPSTIWDDVILVLREREIQKAVEEAEIELGRKVTECMGILRDLSGMHQEERRVSKEQARLSSAGCTVQSRGLAYNYDQQQRLRDFSHHFPDYDVNSVGRQLPLSPEAHALQQIGSTYYKEPSLLSASFNFVWNSLSSHLSNLLFGACRRLYA
ncbi:hypothetical protein DFP72DRAFT_952649 [Ephemerocybe angulata]|uniref:Uncharacterized protein n=1 Tax=Ephemerocybe angulata TaxID=980116 RepID=A0A8H6H5F4_9AGAR|nr:hypothetical protein DFP72DRAFT_952649 [Tulosesus angulatus]